MKKNISINISGIIFHIEEDGYETLKNYLDSIHRYFSSFDDSNEILADIESRIAEIFLSKLNESKQVITADDVDILMSTMGSVRDFQAAEEEQAEEDTLPKGESYRNRHTEEPKSYTERKFYRDTRHKILGGVCAGIAHYLNIDPVWIRLLFVLFVWAWGLAVLAYILLWIFIPDSDNLPDQKGTKKMFRDPETKALGGVSGGIAAYFDIDVIVIRVLFIVFAFAGGVGILAYLVLWMILPEAKSLTDKMKMQGEPVTLFNIETNIKKGLDVKEQEEENILVKVLLFPFRILAEIVSALAKIIGPLAEVIRVAIGIIFILLGIAFALSVVTSIGVAAGIFTMPWEWFGERFASFPIDTLHSLVPLWTIIAAFFTLFIPCLLIMLLGTSIIRKRGVIHASMGWIMFIVFIASISALASYVPHIVFAFKEDGEYQEEELFHMNNRTTVLNLKEVGLDGYKNISLTIKGYSGDKVKLVKSFQAQGSSVQEAIENAQMIEYYVEQKDSILIFNSNFHFKKGAEFRAQRLHMDLYIPYNQPFIMDKGISKFITHYVAFENRDGYTWNISSAGLRCTNCPAPGKEIYTNESFTYSSFDEINISGVFSLKIIKGDTYQVNMSGPESEKNRYKIFQSGNKLIIDYKGNHSFPFNFNKGNDEMEIEIITPTITKIEASGVGKIYFDAISASQNFDLEIQGPINVEGEIRSHHAEIKLTGTSKARFWGEVKDLDAEIKFSSSLEAYDLQAENADIEVFGASEAYVTVNGDLEIEEGVASKVHYRGNPKRVDHD